MIDFLVIGGGIAGLSAAAHLAPFGTTTVLEAEDALGYHASGRSAALFEPNYGNAPTRALSRASEEFLRHNNGGYLSPRGFLLLGIEAENDLFNTDLAGLGCEEISTDEARAMVPILEQEHISRAAFHAGAEDIDTDRLLQDLAKAVRAEGGAVLTGTQATGITRTGQGWQVQTNADLIHARIIINAAGPWADQVAEKAGIAPVGLIPHRRSMARIAAPGGHDVTKWPMFFGAGETWYAKPDAGQLIVSPADEDPIAPMDAWPDDMVLAEGMARYQEFVTEEVTRPLSSWAGLRTFAPDRTLALGPDPSDPTFVWSAGQGGYGFQTSAGAGALVASLTVGNTPALSADLISALSPARFRA